MFTARKLSFQVLACKAELCESLTGHSSLPLVKGLTPYLQNEKCKVQRDADSTVRYSGMYRAGRLFCICLFKHVRHRNPGSQPKDHPRLLEGPPGYDSATWPRPFGHVWSLHRVAHPLSMGRFSMVCWCGFRDTSFGGRFPHVQSALQALRWWGGCSSGGPSGAIASPTSLGASPIVACTGLPNGARPTPALARWPGIAANPANLAGPAGSGPEISLWA